MPTLPEDVKLVVAELLALEWDESNVDDVPAVGSGFYVSTGWRDSGLGAPQVTVSNDEESPDGETGYSGMKSDGSGPTARPRGTVQVNTWVTADEINASSEGVAKKAAKQLRDECKRIIRENTLVDGYDFSASSRVANADVAPYEYISWFGHEYRPDDEDEGELVHRYRCTVRYEYFDEP